MAFGKHAGAGQTRMIMQIPTGCCQQLGSMDNSGYRIKPRQVEEARMYDGKAVQSEWKQSPMEALDHVWTKSEVLGVEHMCEWW